VIRQAARRDEDDGRHHGLLVCHRIGAIFGLKKLQKIPPVLYECILLFEPYYHSRRVHAFELSDPPDGVDYTIKF
jgi:hypothetical protein